MFRNYFSINGKVDYLVIGIISIGFIIYLLNSINSIGFHHPDEHYQIIQFAEYRLGLTQDISWEYGVRMRSAIQPALCMVVFSLARDLGIDDHFVLAEILRWISAFFALLTILIFTKTYSCFIDQRYLKIFYLISFSLWFLPYVNVRFSSENWSGLLCMLAIAKMLRLSQSEDKYLAVVTGILCGLSILFRYQAIFLVLGLVLWVFVVSKAHFSKILILLSSIIGVLLIGVLLDSWFYHEFTVSILNYFQINVINGVATNFGTSPWYEIFLHVLREPGWPFGVIILISFVLIFVFEKTNIIIWTVIPFFIVHMLSPHKEPRFLFVLVNLVPGIIVLGIQIFEKKFLKVNFILSSFLLCIFFIINSFGLLIILTKTPRRGEIELARFIHKTYKRKSVNLITSFDNNPFDPKMNFKQNFYKDNRVRITDINSIWLTDIKQLIKPREQNILVLSVMENTGIRMAKRLKDMHLTKIYSTCPGVLDLLLEIYDREMREKQLELYYFKE